MIIYRFLPYLFFIVFFISCSGRGQKETSIQSFALTDTTLVEFARGFTIEKDDYITILTVSNPWQGAKNVSYRYVLCPNDKKIPEKYSKYPVIRTPVERVICLSTKHVAMLVALGQTSSLKALSGTAFVTDTTIRKAINRGDVVDIGYEHGLNYEKIIGLKPDIIFAYGVNEGLTGALARLKGLGQKVVFNAEYLERTVLGQAEWIKFMAAFYNNEDQAAEKFETIRDEYLSLCQLAKEQEHKPTIMCGLPWQGIWFIPGGETWMAAMINDAGGEYIWKGNNSHESFTVNIETIVNQGRNADIWINAGAARSLAEIISVDERLTILKPFETGAVYNNYARANVNGGNDFFESGVVNPHIILKDMIKIFHPDLLPDYKLYYYMKLE